MNNSWLMDSLTDLEKDTLETEIKYYQSLDISRPVKFSGYFYDTQKNNDVIFKDDCTFEGSRKLSELLIIRLIRSSSSVEFENNTKSLNPSNSNDMLTSWIKIEDLILILSWCDSARKLIDNLKKWQEKGVQEIEISWHKLGDPVINQIDLETRQPTFLCHFEGENNTYAMIFVKRSDDFSPFNSNDQQVVIDQINNFNILNSAMKISVENLGDLSFNKNNPKVVIANEKLKYLSNEYLGLMTISEQYDKALEFQKIVSLDNGSLNFIKKTTDFIKVSIEQLNKAYFIKPLIFIVRLIGSPLVQLDIENEE